MSIFLKKRESNKKVISIKRILTLYYYRFLRLTKILILLAFTLFLFTNVFDTLKKKLFTCFVNITTELGLVLEYLITVGQVNTTDNDIVAAVESTGYSVPIYLLNLKRIREQIEANPWVKMALVERRLPNSLFIAIFEKKPIAIWQFEKKLNLIDEDGIIISPNNIKNFRSLIHVVGQGANIYARNLREDLDKYPDLAQKVVSAVRYSQRRWDLNLEQQINIKMPEKGFREAYDYLNSLNKANKLFNQNYKVINLRDPNKYYIEKYRT